MGRCDQHVDHVFTGSGIFLSQHAGTIKNFTVFTENNIFTEFNTG